MSFLKKAKSVLGLDIGVSSVKIIELTPGTKTVSLVNLGTAPIEIHPDDKEDVARQRAVVKAIKDIITTKKIKTRRVISGLLGQDVFIRMVNLPKSVLEKMQKEQIIGMLKNEIEAEIPFPLEEATVDFFYYGEIEEEKTLKYKITVVVVPQKIIQENLDIIQKAGLRPVVIDTATFALCRAYRRLVKEEDLLKTVALLEISASTTELNIIQEGNLQLTRTINLGGYAFTKAISEALNIPIEEAEKKKKEEDVLETVSIQLEKLIEELRSSFKYYQLQMRQQIEKVILCGGGAKLKNITKFLNQKLGLSVECLNPLENIKYDSNIFSSELLDSLSTSLGVCVGLALRNIKEEKAINFLPFELWERPFIVKRPFLSEGIALSFIVLTLFAVFSLRLAGYTRKFNQTDMSLRALNPQDVLGKLEESKQKKGRLEEDLAIINKLTGEKLAYSEIIKRIVAGLPGGVWLNSLSVGIEEKVIEVIEEKVSTEKKKKREKPKVIVIETLKLTITGSSVKTQDVASFMLYLKTHADFKDVNLVNLQQTPTVEALIMSFTVECTVE